MLTKADWFILAAAFLSFLFSVSLWFGVGVAANKGAGVFVGLWVPSILSAGNYLRQAARVKRNV
ncbi:MAG: hypothetical protein NVS1B11_29220 [Terriglobales bacterium]